jgi:hypothetical protein
MAVAPDFQTEVNRVCQLLLDVQDVDIDAPGFDLRKMLSNMRTPEQVSETMDCILNRQDKQAHDTEQILEVLNILLTRISLECDLFPINAVKFRF